SLTPWIALFQTALLVAAAGVHAHRAQVPSGARNCTWTGCEIDLARRVVRKVPSQASVGAKAVAPVLIGACSVVLYHLLSRLFDQSQLVLLGLLVAIALAAWLSVGPLGRALGQGWRLLRLTGPGDTPFVSDQLPRLPRERQRSALGRLLAARRS